MVPENASELKSNAPLCEKFFPLNLTFEKPFSETSKYDENCADFAFKSSDISRSRVVVH